MTNLSRPVKFEPGTLVMYNGSVRLVDHSSGTDSVHLRDWYNTQPFEVPEVTARKLTRMEFAWYRDPITAKMKVGRTPAVEWLIQFAACILVVVGAFVFLPNWDGWMGIGRGVLMFIAAARIAIMVRGFLRNYKGLSA